MLFLAAINIFFCEWMLEWRCNIAFFTCVLRGFFTFFSETFVWTHFNNDFFGNINSTFCIMYIRTFSAEFNEFFFNSRLYSRQYGYFCHILEVHLHFKVKVWCSSLGIKYSCTKAEETSFNWQMIHEVCFN